MWFCGITSLITMKPLYLAFLLIKIPLRADDLSPLLWHLTIVVKHKSYRSLRR